MESPERRPRRQRSRSPRERNRARTNHLERRQREREEDKARESRLLSARSEVVARDKADGSRASRRRREASDREHSQQERTGGRTDHERQRGRPAEDDRTNNQPNSESTDEQEVVGPNYNLSGKLTEYSNTYKGVVIKYNEPPEARKPKTRWRLYPFKGEEAMSVMYIHRQSAYLLGRQRHIVDIAIDHPSCSKQHAVLQYRLVDGKKADGSLSRKVKPYIIDLESANGTFLNNQRIDPRRFYELKEKDVLKFGFSTREYVILTEKSRDEVHEDQ